MKQAAKWGLCVAMGIGIASAFALAGGDAAWAGKAPPGGRPPAAAPGAVDPPNVKNQGGIQLSPQGIHWGMTLTELASFYDNIIDDDYKELYRRAQPGPATNRLDSAVAEAKAAFRASKIEFNNLPTGIDSTPLKGEYSYRNQELMLKFTRKGVTRYFFFIRGKMWKIYDDVPLREGGALGNSFDDARKKYTDAFQVGGREIQPDYSLNRYFLEVDWKDPTTHIRLVDRSGNKVVGVVYEERATVALLPTWRTNKAADMDAVDPDIQGLMRPPDQQGAVPTPDAGAGRTKGKAR
jgi:hypothetical protein